LSITSVDYAPQEIEDAVPIQVILTRQVPGSDRSDYWLGELPVPIKWVIENQQQIARYAIVSSRWVGHPIELQVRQVPINLALILDESQISEQIVNLSKSKFIAIGVADEISDEAIMCSRHD
jgi:hypothetical protein